MNPLPDKLTRRLLFVLHHGLAEIRNLALGDGNEQIADLADALEILPGIIDQFQEDQQDSIRFVLETYQRKYPGRAFDYLAQFEKYDPPERF